MVLPVLRVLVSMTMPRVVVVVVVVIVVLVVLILACGRDARFFALARRYQTPPAAKASKEGGIFFFGLPFLLLLLLPLFDFFIITRWRGKERREMGLFFFVFFSAFWRRRRSFCHPQNYYCFERAFLLCIFRTYESSRIEEETKEHQRKSPTKAATMAEHVCAGYLPAREVFQTQRLSRRTRPESLSCGAMHSQCDSKLASPAAVPSKAVFFR